MKLSPEPFPVNTCLKQVRLSLGIPAKYPRAIDAWYGAGGRDGVDTHYMADPPPPAGVPVFWSGGPGSAGHVALSAGGGWVWSTDILRRGHWAKVPISLIHTKWGLKYLGWSETLNGVRVHAPVHFPNW